jgi:toxin ParE1/3/4
MVRFEVEDVSARIREIVQAIQILTHSPLLGRPVRGGGRELVIGQDSRGYVVLYRFVVRIDTVFVLAIRNQRGSGYKRAR